MEEKNIKLRVVYNKKTRKLIPFELGNSGEIVITSTRTYDEDDLIVSMVDVNKIDLVNGYLLED